MISLAPKRLRPLDKVGATDERYRPNDYPAKRVALLAGAHKEQ